MKFKFYSLASITILFTAISVTSPAKVYAQNSSFGRNTVSAVGTIGVGCLSGTSAVSGFLSSLSSNLASKADNRVPVKDPNQDSKENCKDAIAYAIAKLALKTITESTLNWVNSGFNGNPFYIQNPTSYYKSVADEKLNYYLKTIPQSSPLFGESIRNTFLSQITGRSLPVNQYPDTFLGKQFKDYNTDFRNGGWDMWFTSLEDQYNPIGSYFRESNRIGGIIEKAQQDIKDELDRGEGFLSQKKCVEYSDKPREITRPIVDPRNNLPYCDSLAVINGGSAEIPENGCSINDYLPNQKPTEYEKTVEKGETKYCKTWKTVTPGSIIADQLKINLGTTVRQAELADELNESLSSIFSALLNQLFNKGLSSLRTKNTTKFDFGGPGSNIVYDSNGNPISLDQDNLYANTANALFNSGQFNIKNPQHIRAAIKTQMDFLNASKDSLSVLNKIVPNTGALDYCIPGPHAVWEEDLSTSFGTLQSYLNTAEIKKDTSTFLNILTGIASLGLVTGSGERYVDIDSYALYDTTKNEPYLFQRQLALRFKKEESPVSFLGKIIDEYTSKINTSYSKEKILSAYASTGTQADSGYIRGMMTDAMREAQNLVTYSSSSVEIKDDYSMRQRQTESNIAELEDIKNEVIKIVTAARNRHIQKKKAEKTFTENTIGCLDKEYNLEDGPTFGQTRREVDDSDIVTSQSEAANALFYSNL